MKWVADSQFQLKKMPNRHYVLHRSNTVNTEINVPKHITNKKQARAWLMVGRSNLKIKETKRKPRANAAAKRNAFPNEERTRSPGYLMRYMLGPEFVRKEPKLNCTVGKKMFHLYNNQGRIGPHARRPVNNMRLETVPASLLKVKPGLVRLGSGRQGVVYMGSTSARGFDPYAIKVSPKDLSAYKRGEIQPAQAEYNIQSKVMLAARDNVVNVYNIVYCKEFVKPDELVVNHAGNATMMDRKLQSVIFMQYANEGTLLEWLNVMANASPRRLDDTVMRDLVHQILTTIQKIQKRYPEFRHNDLHLNNIFVNHLGGRIPRFLIGDFGWARTEKTGTNPAVNSLTANSTTAQAYGVGPETDARYDGHLFLNELGAWVTKNASKATDGFKRTIEFLRTAIPSGYRGVKDKHVNEHRLKYMDPCPGLPTLDALVNSKFLSDSFFNSPSPPKAKPRVPSPPPKAKPKVPSPPKAKPKFKLPSPLSPLGPPRTKVNIAMLRGGLINAKMLASAMPKKPNVPKVNQAVGQLNKRLAKVVEASGKNKNTRPRIKPQVFQSSKFNKMVHKIFANQGGGSNEAYSEAWSRARAQAIDIIRTRLAQGNSHFPASPKVPNAPKRVSPPRAPVKRGNAHTNYRMKLSPKSGRVKMVGPSSERLVYADGATVTMEYLKGIALKFRIDIKGLRSKADIAKKIYVDSK